MAVKDGPPHVSEGCGPPGTPSGASGYEVAVETMPEIGQQETDSGPRRYQQAA